MTDPEVVYSWDMNEYNAFIKGASHKDIDNREFVAWQAIINSRAQNEKRVNQKKLFNAKAARNRIEGGFTHQEQEVKQMIELNRAAKGFNPMAHFKPKGGSS